MNNYNIKYRVKFTKGEEIKYIGHLDIMRLFQRAINRAGLPIAYSNGFNPHQILSFASPLTLGTTSTGEYGDFEMKVYVEPEKMIFDLNEVLPDGIKVTEVVRLRAKVENSMACVDGAEYEAVLDDKVTIEAIKKLLPEYIAQKEIFIMKKTKNSNKEVDIRPDILEIKDISKDGISMLYMLLCSGSRRNLKPELVVESFYKLAGIEYSKFKIRYNRIDLFRTEGDKLVRLNEGVEYIEEDGTDEA